MRYTNWKLALGICAGLALLTLQGHEGHAAKQPQKGPPEKARLKAVCVLNPLGESGVSGIVTFVQMRGGVEVTARVAGLTPGEHGFHIHEFGDCSAHDGSSTGGHFNPTDMPHGGPNAARRHVGDLGNVVADTSGKAEYRCLDKLIRLDSTQSIVGRAVIIHAGRDDLTTQPSGNAGARVACGVIGIADGAK